MFFLRKRKQKRDREAGLVFHWRGAKKHHLGKFIALMVAGSCFAFAAYAIRIEGPKPPLVSKRKGTLIFINENDPNCRRLMLQVEAQSPFPARWDPAYDLVTRDRVAAMAEKVMGEPWEYQAELKLLPPRAQDTFGLTSILEPRAGLLAGMMHTWPQNLDSAEVVGGGDLFVRGSIRVSGELSERLMKQEWILPANLVSEDWFGQSFRFMVGVDSKGIVRSCVSLPGGSMGVVRVTDRQEELAVWLRAQRFKSVDKEGMVFGELELQIDATRE